MTCAICSTDNSEDSRFCTNCGGGLGTSVLPAPADKRNMELTLASANLARSKSNWPEADRLCMEVLRAEPNNVDAYALLGDIHRDQGRLDDAAQWYGMALDLKSDWPAVRSRLADVEKKLARSSGRKAVGSSASAVPSSGTQKLLGATPQTWLQITLTAATVFLLGTVLVLISMRNRPVEKPIPRGSASLTPAPASGFGSPVPQANSSVLGGNASGPPRSVRQTQKPPAQRGFEAPPESNTDGGIAMAPPAAALSAQEMALRELLGRGLGGAQVASVTVDPRLPGATVVLVRPAPAVGTDPHVVRQTLLEEAAMAARGVLTSPDGYRAATVSVRTVGATGRMEPVFSGDTDRALFASALGGANPDLSRVFRNVWWGTVQSQAPAQIPNVEQPPTGGGVEAFDRP